MHLHSAHTFFNSHLFRRMLYLFGVLPYEDSYEHGIDYNANRP